MSENTYQITPFMHVKELGPAIAFFVDTLNFKLFVNDGGYAYLEREGAGMRILEHDDDCEIGVPHRGFAYYIDVKSVETVLEQIGDRLALLPEGDVYGPVDQPYGQREVLIRAPDGNLVIFGAAITP